MRAKQSHPGGSLYSAAGTRKYLNRAERLQFIAAAMACPLANVRSLCLFLAYSGCRISEALSVTRASVTPADGAVAVRSLKRRSKAVIVREIPLPQHCVRILEEVHGLATGVQTRRLWPWSRGHAWYLVKGIMREAGIADGIHATAKGLRHGFGLHAVRSGVPLNLVQRWLGHASMTTTAIYLQAIGDEERALASRMWTSDEQVGNVSIRYQIKFAPLESGWASWPLDSGV